MYWNDHSPPHFHARYNNFSALIDIKTGKVIKGKFPSKQLKKVDKWRKINMSELKENWKRARKNQTLLPIEALYEEK